MSVPLWTLAVALVVGACLGYLACALMVAASRRCGADEERGGRLGAR